MEWFDEVWKGPPNAMADAIDDGTVDEETFARQSAQLDAWQDVFEGLLDRAATTCSASSPPPTAWRTRSCATPR